MSIMSPGACRGMRSDSDMSRDGSRYGKARDEGRVYNCVNGRARTEANGERGERGDREPGPSDEAAQCITTIAGELLEEAARSPLGGVVARPGYSSQLQSGDARCGCRVHSFFDVLPRLTLDVIRELGSGLPVGGLGIEGGAQGKAQSEPERHHPSVRRMRSIPRVERAQSRCSAAR